MNKHKVIILLAAILLIVGCNNPWDEHVKVNENVLQESIGDYLNANAQFSTFVSLLEETGLDALLSSSVIYTVWAPTNAALTADVLADLNTEEKKYFFVANHIAFGSFSSTEGNTVERVEMKNGKKLFFNAIDGLIDNISISTDKEAEVKNGTIQVIETALTPRYSIWEYIELEASSSLFVDFINSLTSSVFHEELSQQIGITEGGRPIYDSVYVKENKFLNEVVDISNEESLYTLLIPSDDLLLSEFDKFQKFYRIEDKRNNVVPSAKDSINILLNLAKDFVLDGYYGTDETADTLLSVSGVKVPYHTDAISSSVAVSNGYIHFTNNCKVEIENKIQPIFMEAEQYIYSTVMESGYPAPYFRYRDNASNGMDFICDNFDVRERLSGVVFKGPKVASIKYRVKIRAINDFNKSYRYGSSSVTMIQKLGTITTVRDPLTNEIVTISEVTNALNFNDKTFGTPDVTGDTIYVTQKEYSPIDSAEVDEIDLGYYEFNRSDNVFLRLLPLSTQMAVMADYFKLVPIIEED